MKRLKIFLFYSILFFTLSFTKDAYAIQYGGFGGLPANPDPNNPRSESIFIYNLEPGQFKQDGVRVLNNTTETKTYIVYSADATKSTDGGFGVMDILCCFLNQSRSDLIYQYQHMNFFLRS